MLSMRQIEWSKISELYVCSWCLIHKFLFDEIKCYNLCINHLRKKTFNLDFSFFFFYLSVVSNKISLNIILDNIYDFSSFQCIACIDHELDQMINNVNVFASSFVALYFEERPAIIISSCQQKLIQFSNVSSFCEKETLFLSHEENTMNTMISSSRQKNTMNTIISSFHVKSIETSSSIVQDTMIFSFQTENMSTFLFREEESIIVSIIDDEIDANLLNEIALCHVMWQVFIIFRLRERLLMIERSRAKRLFEEDYIRKIIRA